MPTSNEEVEDLEQQVLDLRDELEKAERQRVEAQAERANDQRAEDLKKEAARLQAQINTVQQDIQRESGSTSDAIAAMKASAASQVASSGTQPQTSTGVAQSAPTPTGADAKAAVAADADAKPNGQEGR